MNKKIMFIGSIALILALGLVFIGCNNNAAEEASEVIVPEVQALSGGTDTGANAQPGFPNNSVLVSWDAIPDVAGYRVFIAKESGVQNAAVLWLTQDAATDIDDLVFLPVQTVPSAGTAAVYSLIPVVTPYEILLGADVATTSPAAATVRKALADKWNTEKATLDGRINVVVKGVLASGAGVQVSGSGFTVANDPTLKIGVAAVPVDFPNTYGLIYWIDNDELITTHN